MAVQMLNWLSKNVGIDITGENTPQDKKEEDVFDKIGKKVFGPVEDEDGPIPTSDGWGYSYNPATKQWEPTANAPEYIHKEQQDRITQMNAPPPVVQPPPLMDATINYNRDLRGPQYADHFNLYSRGPGNGSASTPNGFSSPPSGSPLPSTSSNPSPPQPSFSPYPPTTQTTSSAFVGGPSAGSPQVPNAYPSYGNFTVPPPPPPPPPQYGRTGSMGGPGDASFPTAVTEHPAANLISLCAPVPPQQQSHPNGQFFPSS